MANRALWSGTMGIGIVLLPTKAYKAVDAAKEGLSLSLLHRDDHSSVRRPFICLECGKEVSMTTDCIHGYKVDDKNYIPLTDEVQAAEVTKVYDTNLKKIMDETNRRIERMSQFLSDEKENIAKRMWKKTDKMMSSLESAITRRGNIQLYVLFCIMKKRFATLPI